MLHLKPGEIDAQRGVLRVVDGKGKKSREVSITPSSSHLLSCGNHCHIVRCSLFPLFSNFGLL
ncbi:MAG: hypothetical protein IH599_06425 [Bacteroidales bacterium]|nr:hypothetical protein [Bacteroidales bacterium]